MCLRIDCDLEAGWLTQGSLHGFHPQVPVPQQEQLGCSSCRLWFTACCSCCSKKINAMLAFASFYSTQVDVLLHKQLRSPHNEAEPCEKRFGCIVGWPMLLGSDQSGGCWIEFPTQAWCPNLFSFSILKKNHLRKKPTATTTKNKVPPTPFQ